jgi:hypothetical protein
MRAHSATSASGWTVGKLKLTLRRPATNVTLQRQWPWPVRSRSSCCWTACQRGRKPGTGAYGSGNDIAVIYPTDRAPIVLAIYTRQFIKDADARNDIVFQATRIALRSIRDISYGPPPPDSLK